MPGARPYLKDFPACRYLCGGPAEVAALLGSPVPPLPLPDRHREGAAYHVRFHPTLRQLLQRYLQALLAQLGLQTPGAPPGEGAERCGEDFAAAFERLLAEVLLADRRQGLLNLCWLAHSKQVAGCLRELENRVGAVRRQKYLLGPHLTTLYRAVDAGARRAAEQAEPGKVGFLAGTSDVSAVVEAVIEDGFAFTEPSFEELDLRHLLAHSRRHRIAPELFGEWHQVLSAEVERRLREGERGLIARLGRSVRSVPRDQYLAHGVPSRLALHPEVLAYVLADAWGTGTRLQSSPRLKAEADRRRPADLLDGLLDLSAALRRFELLSQPRDRIQLLPALPDGLGGEARGRVYDFGESAQVLNNAVEATVLFLDLRGFTRTSEGVISARDLTRELYTVFDSFVPHIRRFGGTVDKFLGDGIMVTFGTDEHDPLGPLNALRAAVLCQEAIIRLRRQGRTEFRMGVSVHHGRVYVARFVADEDSVQTTVIGRNVNLAGRLSSAAKKAKDAEEEEGNGAPRGRLPELRVTVEPDGTLDNEGIVLSRDALVQLESQTALVHSDEGQAPVLEYYDDQISRRLLIRYAGDAKFKGVTSSFPVYEVDFVR